MLFYRFLLCCSVKNIFCYFLHRKFCICFDVNIYFFYYILFFYPYVTIVEAVCVVKTGDGFVLPALYGNRTEWFLQWTQWSLLVLFELTHTVQFPPAPRFMGTMMSLMMSTFLLKRPVSTVYMSDKITGKWTELVLFQSYWRLKALLHWSHIYTHKPAHI